MVCVVELARLPSPLTLFCALVKLLVAFFDGKVHRDTRLS